MIEYILLIFIPFVFSFITIKGKNEKKAFYIGKSEYVRKNSLALPVFFLIYFLLIACRDISIGNDTANYEYYFSAYNDKDYDVINYVELEYIYGLFNWVFHKISHNFQLFLAVTAAFCVYPIAKFYCENRKNSILQIAIFVNLSTFVMLFSGLRQAIAMSIGIIAYRFVKEKKPLCFLIASLIASGFHHSAVILFFMYPLYYFSFKKRDLWYIIPAISLVFLFNEQIFTTLANIMALFSSKYEDVTIEHTGAITVFLMFIAFTIFCYLVPDESKMDREMLGLRNILLFSMVLQSFASLHTLAMRMNYYYMIFIPIIMAKVIEVPKERYKQVAKIGSAVITVFLLAYYFYTIYSSYKTGESALNTVPYVAFWESNRL